MVSKTHCVEHDMTHFTSEGCPECYFQEQQRQRGSPYHGTRKAKSPMETAAKLAEKSMFSLLHNTRKADSPLHTRKPSAPVTCEMHGALRCVYCNQDGSPDPAFEPLAQSETVEEAEEYRSCKLHSMYAPNPDCEDCNSSSAPSNPNPMFQGYRELNALEISRIKLIKDMADEVQILLQGMKTTVLSSKEGMCSPDLRWVQIAETHLQQGFMALTRAIAKPTTF